MVTPYYLQKKSCTGRIKALPIDSSDKRMSWRERQHMVIPYPIYPINPTRPSSDKKYYD